MNKHRHILLSSLILFAAFLIYTCKEKPTQPSTDQPTNKPSLSLRVLINGFHEIILGLTNETKDSTTNYILIRDKNEILNSSFGGKDTILYDLNVLGAATYLYQAVRLKNNNTVDSSNVVVAKTRNYDSTLIDTTSHDFTWTITTIGDGQSYLYDVFALQADDIWLAGQIRFVDSTGKLDDVHQLNAAHWDGNEWKAVYVPVKTAGDTSDQRIPLRAVYSLAKDNVWFASDYTSFVHWNGQQYQPYIVPKGAARGSPTKIFGINNSSIYFAGTHGSLTYWDGTRFKLIETNTDIDINDIYGYGGTILAIASNWFSGDATSKVIQIQNQQATFFNETGLLKGLTSIWFQSLNRIYAFGGNSQMWDGSKWEDIRTSDFGPGFIQGMRGESENDIFAVGHESTIGHFNGKSWKWFKNWYTNGWLMLLSVSTLPNEMYAVGYNERGKGVIVHGRRIK